MTWELALLTLIVAVELTDLAVLLHARKRDRAFKTEAIALLHEIARKPGRSSQ